MFSTLSLRLWRLAALTIVTTIVVILIAGCGAISTQLESTTPIPQSITGRVHGGAQGVVGAHIYLYAAGTTGYGGASVSLLNPTHPGVSSDSYGAYVVTDSASNFNISGAYSCVPGQGVYILARGGNPGLAPGITNPALTLIAALGSCPDSGTLAGSVPVVTINEVTTVAAVYALAGFMTDATHLSSPSTPLARQAVTNAFLTIRNLADLSTGTARSISVAANGVPPRPTVNTLANMLTACVNSNGVSVGCNTLFTNSKSIAGTVPTDTASAALNIAHNPAANVTALFNLAVAAPPFQPTLSAAPNDWTVGITFYADLMAGPYYPAVDALGNLWVPDFANNTITEFDPLGIPISGYSGYSGNNLNQPYAIAIDSSQSAWVANYSYGTSAFVSKFSTAGQSANSFACGSNCTAVATDSLQNIWVAASSGVQTMHNSGIAINQFNTTGLAAGIAIDSTGRGWSIGTTPKLYRLTLPNTVDQFTEAVTSTNSGDLNLLAIDSNDNIWFASGKNNAIGRVDSKGALVSPTAGYTGGGLKYPAQVAIDGSNRVWVANRDGNSVSAFNNDGSAISPSTGYRPSGQGIPDPSIPLDRTGILAPRGLAIDGAGNVWVTNFTANSVTELVGAATPVVTPISPSSHGLRP